MYRVYESNQSTMSTLAQKVRKLQIQKGVNNGQN